MRGAICAAVGFFAIALFSADTGAQMAPGQSHGGPTVSRRAWMVTGGQIVVSFNAALLESLGVGLLDVKASAEPPADSLLPMEPPYVGFAIQPESSLLVSGANNAFGGFLAGELRVVGGFSLVSQAGASHFHDFGIREATATEAAADSPPYLRLDAGSADAGELILETASVAAVDTSAGTLTLGGIGMALSAEAAGRLGRPELTGQVFGVMAIVADLTETDGEVFEAISQPPAAARGVTGRDVMLGELYGIGVAARTGTYPNGLNGCSMATTSCNVGSVDVEWFAPMAEDHPGIAMNLYRVTGDRFEQIGQSWVKHGFFALSSSQCTPCQNPSNGTYLGVGCSDTYGFSSNASRTLLGPRNEWLAHPGTWECTGSHFDGVPVDCVRSHGSSGHDADDHMLRVHDKDLDTPGASFYYEAFYVVRDDDNILNNVGHKPVEVSWTGSSWSFTSTGFGTPPTPGPVIEAWGDGRTAITTELGRLYVGWNVTDLGGGTWRYTYAIYNLTFDPAIRAISIPVADSVSVTASGMSFYYDQEMPYLGSKWLSVHSNGMLTFATPFTYAVNPLDNACRWGATHTIWFECDAPPANDVTASLEVFEPAAVTNIEVLVTAPQAPSVPCICGDLATPPDGVVDLEDFAAFSACFGQSPADPSCACSDLNADGMINLTDFSTFAAVFGSPTNGQSPPNCLP